MSAAFPFSAIVGQDEMKLSILCAAVDPRIGGVLVFGDRGTGKSTAVRALAALLPPMRAVSGCPYQCDPQDTRSRCADCARLKEAGRVATRARVGELLLTHIPPWTSREDVISEAKAEFDGPVRAVLPGECIEVRRS